MGTRCHWACHWSYDTPANRRVYAIVLTLVCLGGVLILGKAQSLGQSALVAGDGNRRELALLVPILTHCTRTGAPPLMPCAQLASSVATRTTVAL